MTQLAIYRHRSTDHGEFEVYLGLNHYWNETREQQQTYHIAIPDKLCSQCTPQHYYDY